MTHLRNNNAVVRPSMLECIVCRFGMKHFLVFAIVLMTFSLSSDAYALHENTGKDEELMEEDSIVDIDEGISDEEDEGEEEEECFDPAPISNDGLWGRWLRYFAYEVPVGNGYAAIVTPADSADEEDIMVYAWQYLHRLRGVALEVTQEGFTTAYNSILPGRIGHAMARRCLEEVHQELLKRELDAQTQVQMQVLRWVIEALNQMRTGQRLGFLEMPLR